MNIKKLKCFGSYDIRGVIDVDINETIFYLIGRAVAQHLNAKFTVIGYDARSTSKNFSKSVQKGLMESGSDVINIGLAGAEEVYWAVNQYNSCAGIIITASHNPINYNGMKIVQKKSYPLDKKKDWAKIQELVISQKWGKKNIKGILYNKTNEARQKYINKVLNFIDIAKIKPLNIVVNCGNGAAGPSFNLLSKKLLNQGAPINFITLNEKPDPTFPNGIPNPLIEKNNKIIKKYIIEYGADLGIAFDGDFDRCFFFDEKANLIPGEYIVGLLASIFLDKEPRSTILHDTKVIWNINDVIKKNKGTAVQSKTGHSHFKKAMLNNNAVYGGELSGHHYFRDFSNCDSGMIPWLLIVEFISQFDKPISHLLRSRYEKFPSSGEINLKVCDANKAIQAITKHYAKSAKIKRFDGINLDFNDIRLNLRKSNTEPILRLNVETKNSKKSIEKLVSEVLTVTNAITV